MSVSHYGYMGISNVSAPTWNGTCTSNDQVPDCLIVEYFVNIASSRITNLLQDDGIIETKTCIPR